MLGRMLDVEGPSSGILPRFEAEPLLSDDVFGHTHGSISSTCRLTVSRDVTE